MESENVEKKDACLVMTRELFVETMEQLRLQEEHDNRCIDAMHVVYPDADIVLYKNDWIYDQLLKLVKLAMGDVAEDNEMSWIEYFIYELEFGKKYAAGKVLGKEGEEIDLGDAGKLYDFLIDN